LLPGFEVSVLKRARRRLDRSPDACLIVEVSPASLRSAGRAIADLLDQLPELWAQWLIDENGPDASGKSRPLDKEARGFLDLLLNIGPATYWLLVVPRHRTDEVGQIVVRIAVAG
jgi:hypothetical protein